MATKAAPKNSAKTTTLRFDLRCESQAHFDLIRAAALDDKRSVNGWLIKVTLDAARQQLKTK